MKTRNGFVSNSSSSSFVIFVKDDINTFEEFCEHFEITRAPSDYWNIKISEEEFIKQCMECAYEDFIRFKKPINGPMKNLTKNVINEFELRIPDNYSWMAENLKKEAEKIQNTMKMLYEIIVSPESFLNRSSELTIRSILSGNFAQLTEDKIKFVSMINKEKQDILNGIRKQINSGDYKIYWETEFSDEGSYHGCMIEHDLLPKDNRVIFTSRSNH